MLPTETQARTSGAEIPPEFELVGSYATERAAAEHGLVVLAMGLSTWTTEGPESWGLWAPAVSRDRVREQLDLFDRESSNWPPRPQALPRLEVCWPPSFLTAGILVMTFWMQRRFPGELESIGALDAAALFGRGEWWRPVTALFLHGDVGHLIANLGAGFFMLALVLGMLGRLRGGLLLAAASTLGNIAAAALHPTERYISLGASTGVFAALGLLTGAAIRRVLSRVGPPSLRALLLPALAGVSLLALYGTGGLQTDVIAHGTGFAAGTILGLIARGRHFKAVG